MIHRCGRIWHTMDPASHIRFSGNVWRGAFSSIKLGCCHMATSATLTSNKRISSFRHNTYTNQWVAFPGDIRKQRPKESNGHTKHGGEGCSNASVRYCPFCETTHSTPLHSLLSIRTACETETDEASELIVESPGCPKADASIYVLPNLYPVVAQSSCILDPLDYGPGGYVEDPALQCELLADCFEVAQSKGGTNTSVEAIGFHEIVVDSNTHNLTMSEQTALYWRMLFTAFRTRLRTLMDVPLIQSICCFKNVGSLAGASIKHPHSQIVALPIVPERELQLHEHAKRYYEAKSRCVVCDYIQQELRDKYRIVEECDDFVAVIPYAATIPYQLTIFPKRHKSQFAHENDFMLLALSRILAAVFSRIDCALKDPDYNLVLKNAVFQKGDSKQPLPEKYYHWYVEIYPRLDSWPVAGFEFGSGIMCNSHYPEEDASALRTCRLIDPHVW